MTPNVAFKAETEANIEKFLPLVKHIASKFSYSLPPSLEYADLVAIGLVGLLDATKKFDPHRGIEFQTYATYRVRGEILNRLSALRWVPRAIWEKMKDLEQVAARLQNELGRPANEGEIAKALGLSMEEYEKFLTVAGPTGFLSLDELIEGDQHFVEPKDGDDPVDKVSRQLTKECVAQVLTKLPEKERTVVSLYFYEDLTLREIGRVLNVSESRSCQLLSQAMARLRGLLTEEL